MTGAACSIVSSSGSIHAAKKMSPRWPSRHATTRGAGGIPPAGCGAESGPGEAAPACCRRQPSAIASSVGTGATGRPVTRASPWTTAMPTRRPVNDPGPARTAKRSTSPHARPWLSRSATISPGSRSPFERAGSPVRTVVTPSTSRAVLPRRVTVSIARTTMTSLFSTGGGRVSICGKLLRRSFPQIETRPPPVENTYYATGRLRHRHALSALARRAWYRPSSTGLRRRDARHAAVLRRQASVPRCHRLLPHGRFLRDVLRGRPDGGARARVDTHLARQGRVRQPHSDVRRAVPRGRYVPRPARARRVPGRDLRAGRGPAKGQGPRQA